MIIIEIIAVSTVLALLFYGTLQLIKSRQDEKPVMIIPPADTKADVSPELLEKMKTAFSTVNVKVSADAVEAMAALGRAARQTGKVITSMGASVQRVLDSKTWHISKPAINWHDVWLGVYWKYTENSDIDTDILDIYVCLIPCIVIHIIRVRCYIIIPRVDNRIDPVCWQCGMPHSSHPMLNMNNLASGKDRCDGKFTI